MEISRPEEVVVWSSLAGACLVGWSSSAGAALVCQGESSWQREWSCPSEELVSGVYVQPWVMWVL